MKVAVSSDMDTPLARKVVDELRRRGYEPIVHGALAEGVSGEAEQGIVCCWTGTGASIAANKVPGIRAALCADSETARGARTWNDANVLALSLRGTSEALLGEILDGWFATGASDDPGDRANIDHLGELDHAVDRSGA
jgi:ribose 5-phosphate isomerase B